MMAMRYHRHARFALYFDPEADSALSDFGWGWLGRTRYDPAYQALPVTDLHPDWHASAVAPPRLYGFHATLKAPISLRQEYTPADFFAACEAFATRQSAFTLPPLILSEADGYLSLRTARHETTLHHLADACVMDFDRFRVALPPEEMIRRGQATLPPAERAMLERWGYPYVLTTFRFHMTLSRHLDDPERHAMRQALAPLLAPVLVEPVAVRAVSVFVQPAPGAPFVVAERFAFKV